MNLIVTNIADGTSHTLANGGEVRLLVPESALGQALRRMIWVRTDTALTLVEDLVNAATGSGEAYWRHYGDLAATQYAQTDISSDDRFMSVELYYDIGGSGFFEARQVLRFTHPLTLVHMYVTFILVVCPRALYVVRPAWLAAAVIDLRFDLQLLSARSADMGALADWFGSRPVLMAGGEPTFAVMPVLAGEILAEDVTALSLVIRRDNHFDEDALVTIVGTDADLVSGGAGEDYYALSGPLKSDALTAAFVTLNANPIPNEPDSVRELPCLMQLCVTYDGAKFVSAQIPILLRQPCDLVLLA